MKSKILWINTYRYTEIICTEGDQQHPEHNEKDRAYIYIDVLFTTGAIKKYQINWDKTKEWDNVPHEIMRWIHGSITKCYTQNHAKEINGTKATYRIQTKYKQF